MSGTTSKVRDTLPPGVPNDGGAPADGGAKPPKFGTPRPAEQGVVPRFVDGLERAPAGLKRFKIGCRSHRPVKTRYILADDEKQAREFFEANSELKTAMAAEKAAGFPTAEPALAVTVLPD